MQRLKYNVRYDDISMDGVCHNDSERMLSTLFIRELTNYDMGSGFHLLCPLLIETLSV